MGRIESVGPHQFLAITCPVPEEIGGDRTRECSKRDEAIARHAGAAASWDP